MQDFIWVQRARGGDRAALDKLVRKYYAPIYNYIYRRTMHRETAEDLTQETFLKMTKSLGRFIPVAQFSTFLYRLAHNTVVDFYRAGGRDLLPEEAEEERAGPAEETLYVEEKVLVEELLDGLPQEQRECLILHYFQQLKYREIAKILQIPVNTVKTRVRRGLENCRKRMEGEL